MPNSVTCHFLSTRSRFRFHISPYMMPGAGVNEREGKKNVALCLTQTQSQMVFLLRPKRRERTRRHSRTRMCDFQHNPPKREKERKENDIPSSSFSHLSLFENSGPFPVILTKSCVNSRRGHIERANISFILVCLEEKWRGYGKCNVG